MLKSNNVSLLLVLTCLVKAHVNFILSDGTFSFMILCADSTLIAVWEHSKSINILNDGLDVVSHSETKLADQIQQCHPNIDCKDRFPAICTPEPAEMITISEVVAAKPWVPKEAIGQKQNFSTGTGMQRITTCAWNCCASGALVKFHCNFH